MQDTHICFLALSPTIELLQSSLSSELMIIVFPSELIAFTEFVFQALVLSDSEFVACHTSSYLYVICFGFIKALESGYCFNIPRLCFSLFIHYMALLEKEPTFLKLFSNEKRKKRNGRETFGFPCHTFFNRVQIINCWKFDFLVSSRYDGQRAQIHRLADGSVRVFSRNGDETTSRFPDLVGIVVDACDHAAETFILDAEVNLHSSFFILHLCMFVHVQMHWSWTLLLAMCKIIFLLIGMRFTGTVTLYNTLNCINIEFRWLQLIERMVRG